MEAPFQSLISHFESLLLIFGVQGGCRGLPRSGGMGAACCVEARLLRGRQPKTMTQHAEIAALNRLPEALLHILLQKLERMPKGSYSPIREKLKGNN